MARHRLTTKDYTSTSGMFNLAAACREGGDGQCDGFLDSNRTGWRNSDECHCVCHSGRGNWATISTVAQMEEAHAEKNRIALTPRRKLALHKA